MTLLQLRSHLHLSESLTDSLVGFRAVFMEFVNGITPAPMDVYTLNGSFRLAFLNLSTVLIAITWGKVRVPITISQF